MTNNIKYDSFEDAVKCLSSLNSEGTIYRGYSFDIELLPQLFRDKGYIKNEKKILQEFEKYNGIVSKLINNNVM